MGIFTSGGNFLYGNNPYINLGYYQNLAGPEKLDYAGQQAKGVLKKFNQGADVSSYGALNSINQFGAEQAANIEAGAGQGDAALMSAQGGDQANLALAAKNKALNQNAVNTGNMYMQGLTNLYGQSQNQLNTSNQMRDQNQQFYNNLLANMTQYKYPNQYQQPRNSFFGNMLLTAMGNAASAGKASAEA